MLSPIYGVGIPGLGDMTDFKTLKNRGNANQIANEYIVAPPSFTPRARPQEVAPEFQCSADDLEKYFSAMLAKQPRVNYVNEDTQTRRKEYIQRSLLFRYTVFMCG